MAILLLSTLSFSFATAYRFHASVRKYLCLCFWVLNSLLFCIFIDNYVLVAVGLLLCYFVKACAFFWYENNRWFWAARPFVISIIIFVANSFLSSAFVPHFYVCCHWLWCCCCCFRPVVVWNSIIHFITSMCSNFHFHTNTKTFHHSRATQLQHTNRFVMRMLSGLKHT